MNTVFAYLKVHAQNGLCHFEGYSEISRRTGLKAGRVAAIFYYFCGEGFILQDAKCVLLLEEPPFFTKF